MSSHLFILQTGFWSGEGKIQLNMIEEELHFQTTWKILSENEGKISCVQEIHIDGLSETMKNTLTFSEVNNNAFTVMLTNQNIENVPGKGIIDQDTIAWEFKDKETNFEGFEVYHLESDGSYKMHAEYVTSDQFRTKIVGHIRKSSPQDSIEVKEDAEEEES